MGMMAQTLPPIPSAGGPPSPDTEAPPLAQAPVQEPTNDVRDRAQTIMRQLMDARRLNDALAEQYPPAAKELGQANDALKAAMLKIVREVQNQPGSNPQPPVGMG
jgi:hypothetical protein